MRRRIFSYFIIATASGFFALVGNYFFLAVGDNQSVSTAGQTLLSLSRALEREKVKSGFYPESIEGMDVDPDSGDFSSELLSEVVYFRTDQGYVAFVGRPHVSYILPGVGSQHK